MKKKWEEALAKESPLQIVGVTNALVAKMVEDVGFSALYLSGAGVANYAFGLPDTGVTTWQQLAEEAHRITQASDLPLLVDIDTGWKSLEETKKGVLALVDRGVAAIQIEDQPHDAKRCGHLPGKRVVSIKEMEERIRAVGSDVYVIARTDALESEGVEGVRRRAERYWAAGANALFLEAITDLKEVKGFKIPLLINLTEFGKTPLYSLEELKSASVAMALYPLSAARAMHGAAQDLLRILREEGTQKGFISKMQTREELYRLLGYNYEF